LQLILPQGKPTECRESLVNLAAMLSHESAFTAEVFAKLLDRVTEDPARHLEAVRRA
jgi:hypothetical protein